MEIRRRKNQIEISELDPFLSELLRQIPACANPDGAPAAAALAVLARERNGSTESWVVSGWQSDMTEFFARGTTTLREVNDLDLEEGFVELLRSSRRRT